jgi:hypothetical protein
MTLPTFSQSPKIWTRVKSIELDGVGLGPLDFIRIASLIGSGSLHHLKELSLAANAITEAIEIWQSEIEREEFDSGVHTDEDEDDADMMHTSITPGQLAVNQMMRPRLSEGLSKLPGSTQPTSRVSFLMGGKTSVGGVRASVGNGSNLARDSVSATAGMGRASMGRASMGRAHDSASRLSFKLRGLVTNDLNDVNRLDISKPTSEPALESQVSNGSDDSWDSGSGSELQRPPTLGRALEGGESMRGIDLSSVADKRIYDSFDTVQEGASQHNVVYYLDVPWLKEQRADDDSGSDDDDGFVRARLSPKAIGMIVAQILKFNNDANRGANVLNKDSSDNGEKAPPRAAEALGKKKKIGLVGKFGRDKIGERAAKLNKKRAHIARINLTGNGLSEHAWNRVRQVAEAKGVESCCGATFQPPQFETDMGKQKKQLVKGLRGTLNLQSVTAGGGWKSLRTMSSTRTFSVSGGNNGSVKALGQMKKFLHSFNAYNGTKAPSNELLQSVNTRHSLESFAAEVISPARELALIGGSSGAKSRAASRATSR